MQTRRKHACMNYDFMQAKTGKSSGHESQINTGMKVDA
jgi:hypothetical protein